MGGLYSRNKGKRGEREVRDLFKGAGFEARRGQQFAGSPNSPDVVVPDLPGLLVESKNVEKLDLHAAMIQAIKDAAGIKTPVIFHKKARTQWLVTMTAADWLELISETHHNDITHDDPNQLPQEQVEDGETRNPSG